MAGIIAYSDSDNDNELTNQVTIKLTGSLMEMENTILDNCNEIGCLATTDALQKFDTGGSPIKLGETKMTARDKDNGLYFSLHTYGEMAPEAKNGHRNRSKFLCCYSAFVSINFTAHPKPFY